MRSARRTPVALLVLALVVATASACVQLPDQKTENAPPWTPATAKSSIAFLQHYDTVHLEAAEQRDAGLVATVETGPLLRTSEGAYQIARRVDPDHKDPTKPFTRADPAIHLPRFDNYPAWLFGISKRSDDAGREVVDLVTRSGAGTGWRSTISVALDPNEPTPKLQSADGAAVQVTPKLAESLRRPPDRAAAAYAALLAGGPKSPQATAFTPHGLTTTAHQSRAAFVAQTTRLKFKQTFQVVGFRSLMAEDGGALLVFAVAEKTNITVLPGQAVTFKPTEDVAAYTGVTTAAKFVRGTWMWQIAAYVPAKGKGDGLVRLLGINRSLASAEMA